MGTGCTGRKYVKNKVCELRRKLWLGAAPAELNRLHQAVRKAQRDWQGQRRGALVNY